MSAPAPSRDREPTHSNHSTGTRKSPELKAARAVLRTPPKSPGAPVLDWRLNANLSTKWECLLDNELFTDYTFYVGDTRHPLKCHQLVLKMQSKFFEDVLSSPAENDSLEVRECKVNAFRKMLKYLYTEKLDVAPEEAMDILLIAKRFQLTTLQGKCGRIVLDGMNVNNVCIILKKADEIGDKQLGLKAQEFIIQNASQAICTEAFKEVSISSLKKLLQTPHRLWNTEEVRILEAVKAWATAECNRQGKPSTGPNQYDVAKSAFEQINFKQFTTLDFTRAVVKQKLLPNDLMLEIQSELIEKEDDMKLQETFRTPSVTKARANSSFPALQSPEQDEFDDSEPLLDRNDSDMSSFVSWAPTPPPPPPPSSHHENPAYSSIVNFVNYRSTAEEHVVSYGPIYTLSRYSCPILEDWKTTGDGSYKISFSCSFPINIVGVSLYGHASSALLTDVSIKFMSYDEDSCHAEMLVQSCLPEGGGEVDVMFEKPVHIEHAKFYTIVVLVNGRVSPYGTGGRKNYSIDVGSSIIEFNFKNSEGVRGASHVRGQLPKIYFTII